MPSIADILLEHTRKHFPVYSSYCAAQPAMDRRLKHLRQSSPGFAAALQELEGDQVCQGLSLYSFLMLPMQRVTRLPLLCSALLSHLPPSHPQLLPAQQALAALTSLVGECNEAARREEREEAGLAGAGAAGGGGEGGEVAGEELHLLQALLEGLS